MSRAVRDETSPLLAPPSVLTQDDGGSSGAPEAKRALRPIIILILLLKFFAMFGYYHLMAPKLRVLENAVCRVYYEANDPSSIDYHPAWPGYSIEESKCKLPEVQQRLSDLRAWGVFFDALITLFLSIPYGFLADRYGRRLAYILCISGLILSNAWVLLVCTYYDTFNTTAILASTAFLAVGGGSNFVMAIVITMIVDVTHLEARSTVMYWALSAYYLGYVSGIGLSSATMTVPWLPFFLALLSFCSGIALACFMPETNKSEKKVDYGRPRNSMLDEWHENSKTGGLLDTLVKSQLMPVWHYLVGHKVLVVLIALFPIMAARGTVIELVLPYVSKRYDWPLSRVALLDAMSGSIGLLLGVVVLPGVERLLRQRHYSPMHANGMVARYSAGALSVSAMVVGFAPNIGVMIAGWALYSTGFGVRMSILSMVTAMVDSRWAGRVNAIVITSETIVDLTIGPLIWESWSFALGIGGVSLGLPFFIVSAALLVVFLVVMGIRLDGECPKENANAPVEAVQT